MRIIQIIYLSITINSVVMLKSHPDVFLNTRQLIEKYGYHFENHTVQTKDGYILELHRIPYGRNFIGRKTLSAILLVPGLVCDSSIWVNMGRQNSLGFLLADKGFDVWLANYRGTTWSRKHVTLNPDVDKKEFWNYSYHEIGIYDLPAFIDYVLNVTNQTKLFYFGHSQGTTVIFTLLTMKPEYNKKIRLAVAFSPVAYTAHVASSLALPILIIDTINKFVDIYQKYELLPYSNITATISDAFCRDGSSIQPICVGLITSIVGYAPERFNKTLFPVMFSNIPAGMSFKQYLHYAQNIKSKLYRQFDYGPANNLIKYGQLSPPEYDLSKATIPFALYYGDKDLLSVTADVKRLIRRLPNVVVKSLLKGFAHLDFLWGVGVVQLLYEDVFHLIQKY